MKSLFLFSALLLFSLTTIAQQKPAAAKTILADAYIQAAEQHKNVLLIFHASWCGWCRKMDASINTPACKKLFNDNYIIVHLTVLESQEKKQDENEGAEDLMKKYNGYEAGLPFWLILDKDGNLLADSFMKTTEGKPSNIGCPASDAEVSAFTKILKETAPLTDKELAIITTVFRKNDIR